MEKTSALKKAASAGLFAVMAACIAGEEITEVGACADCIDYYYHGGAFAGSYCVSPAVTGFTICEPVLEPGQYPSCYVDGHNC